MQGLAGGFRGAVGSDAVDGGRTRRRPLRMTLRLRLTLLYGACFLVAGAGLLAITYVLFSNSTGGSTVARIRGTPVAVAGGLTAGFINARTGGPLAGIQARSPATGTRLTTRPGGPPSPPAQLLAAVRRYRQEVQAFAKHANVSIKAVTRQANFQLAVQRSNDKASLLLWSAVALGGMALLSILLGWLVAGRALRPLRTMNHRAREITEESLHQRIGVEPRFDELGELAATFDQLLERLERAFDAQRRFVANASHELRTPLTLERTLVEVALADPDASVQSLRRCCERVLSSSAQQEQVIDALLTLARGQAGIESREPVDLAELVEDLLAVRTAAAASLTVDAKLEVAVVDGDRALLERLVANLIDNAVTHNVAHDGWIRVRTGVDRGQPSLRISNSGLVVPPDRLEELFEPFRRLEGERIGQNSGLGLGLSIVRAIAVAHGAELEARSRAEGGLDFELRFAPGLSRSAGVVPATPGMQ